MHTNARINPNYTKRGPGRKHQQGLLTYISDTDTYVKRQPVKTRYPAALGCSHYKGQPVVSYAEADRARLHGLKGLPPGEFEWQDANGNPFSIAGETP